MKKVERAAALKINGFIALCVWSLWLVFGGQEAFAAMAENWRITLTMIFGSLIAGLTSEGGGAVAFPVFTKVLHIHPDEARVFCLAIQSVGMTAAAACIVAMRVNVEWRVIRYASLGGIFGIIYSTFGILPFVAPPLVKIAFTVMVSSLAVALVLLNLDPESPRHERLPVFGSREKAMFFMTGLCGGMMSGLVGSGIDIISFAPMVLLFRLSEKVATPTTVILMGFNTVVGFTLHWLVLDGFTETVRGYWLAAVPVVVVGAPLGALLCSYMNRAKIAWFLVFLIAIELISTILIIPMSAPVAITAGATLAACGLLNWMMFRTRTYQPQTVTA